MLTPIDLLPNVSAEMAACLENCDDCHSICTALVNHCLQMGGRHAQAYHIVTLIDCAQICHTSVDFMLRGSAQHAMICDVCAQACLRCAENCEQIADGDVMMLECAQVCRRCADSCHVMAGMRM